MSAFLCEKLLEERDGSLTPVRILESTTVEAFGPNAPREMPAVQVTATLVVLLAAGAALGRVNVALRWHLPSVVDTRDIVEGTVIFGGNPGEVRRLVLDNLTLGVDTVGLYWFDVLVEGRLVTRIPWRVNFKRTSVGPS